MITSLASLRPSFAFHPPTPPPPQTVPDPPKPPATSKSTQTHPTIDSALDSPNATAPVDAFVTAKSLAASSMLGGGTSSSASAVASKKRKFNSPLMTSNNCNTTTSSNLCKNANSVTDEELNHPLLASFEPKIVQLIKSEIMDTSAMEITWDDIAGLKYAKETLQESVIWPLLRPDIFQGLRHPPKGILLYGPPGTGKTMIGKCIASQSGATFFSISSSSLTSKYVGDGEKMVRALFAVARIQQPSVIFIDEIDSLLSQRSEGEVDATRRIKTEFLVQFDGVTTNGAERVLVIGATNRPNELDEAARRRFRKRLYIELPDTDARKCLMRNLLAKQSHTLTPSEMDLIASRTEGYSGSDMDGVCREAALGPIRAIRGDIRNVQVDQVRDLAFEDFEYALKVVKKSVAGKDLEFYLEFDKEFGAGRR